MRIEAAVYMYLSYINEHARPNTIRNFTYTISKFNTWVILEPQTRKLYTGEIKSYDVIII